MLAECRAQADDWSARGAERPRSYIGAAVIVLLWLAAGYALWIYVEPRFMAG